MKFPRNARIFRGQLDAAPFASVFFVLVIFVLLRSLVHTPGVRIQLPVTDGKLAVADGPTVAVAVDASGQFYFENQRISEAALSARLQAVASSSPRPLTLVVLGDKAMTNETLNRLAAIARKAGILELLDATMPRVFDSPQTAPSGS